MTDTDTTDLTPIEWLALARTSRSGIHLDARGLQASVRARMLAAAGGDPEAMMLAWAAGEILPSSHADWTHHEGDPEDAWHAPECPGCGPHHQPS